ncbi:DoxX family protein [Pedobacter sp. SL55]|uniref:DoxX family protein n=1 Tax=Pedobacter sp. SL55 TaxID=2995161 RepID=UPI00226D7325|nr:DoxX family protein [Pedobacter sp. SL55]WAC38976.1 DoxX family protein [Pedobacter sp. SL55]
MKIVKIVICVLFGLMFINGGLNKFFNYIPVPELPADQLKVMTAMTAIPWLMPLLATMEIVGGVLIAIPKTRALGAIVIFPMMVGIVLHHIMVAPEGIIMAAVLFLINVWVIADNSSKYKPMVS